MDISANIIIICIVIFGFILFVMAQLAFENIQESCSDYFIKTGWLSLCVVGSCMIAAGVSYFICDRMGECSGSIKSIRSSELFISIFLMLCIFSMSISAVILSKYRDLNGRSKTWCDNGRGTTLTCTVITLVISAISCVILFILLLKRYTELTRKIGV